MMNEFLVYMNEKLNKGNSLDPKAIGWSLMPKINALVRLGSVEDKETVFNGFVGNIDKEEALKVANRCYRLQTTEIKRLVDELEPTIDHTHKAIVCFGNKEDASLLGLVANKFCGKYNKPTIILRELNSTTWTGSLRSPIDLAEKINESGLAEAIGHSSACGVFLKKSNLDRFISWLDTLDLSAKPAIDVTACVKPEALNTQLMKSIQDKKILWGKGMEQPTFFIKQKVKSSQVFVFEKKTTTIKVVCGDLSCIKFFAKPEDVEAFKKYDEFELEMVIGDCGTNEWEGVVTPQGVIKEYEIKPIEKKEESWEDLF